jgi:hypothetical protein
VFDRFASWKTALDGNEGLETFTDWQGFTWCISSDGRRAVLKYGPAKADGRYDWGVARAMGQEVDLSRPASDHTDSFNGPCQFEVFTYLLHRGYQPAPAKTTAISVSPLTKPR